jgi:hypothetical protein
MGRALDNAMLNVGMKKVAEGAYLGYTVTLHFSQI